MPSITYKGSFPPLIDPTPLMRIVPAVPGFPETDCTCTPLSFPCNNWSNVAYETDKSSFIFKEDMAPVTSLRCCVEYPTTTTSFMDCSFSSRMAFISFLFFM